MALLSELQEALVAAAVPSWIPVSLGPPLQFDGRGAFVDEAADTDRPPPEDQ